MTPAVELIKPQPGPQTQFLQTSADIAVYGGAAGGGKTFALLLEGVRHVANSRYGFVIFRRTSPEIRNEGGLWDESAKIYPAVGGKALASTYEWRFPSGSKARFSHLQYESDMYSWQGSQIPMIGFDELTHFTERQFFYLLSRNRSTCGVKPYIRATCNPLATSWVKKFLAPWVDDLFHDPAASGEIRWFCRESGAIRWHDDQNRRITKSYRGPDGEIPKSVTFIRSTIYDNQILMQQDPGYLANLMALPLVERARLLNGDWNIVATGGTMFRREWFPVIEQIPDETITRRIRFWDLAATEQRRSLSGAMNDPDWTVGCLMSEDANRNVYLEDIIRVRQTPKQVEDLMRKTALLDGLEVEIHFEQEPGSAGVFVADHLIREVFRGYPVTAHRSSGSKIVRAKPLSAQAEHGSVFLKLGYWNEAFLLEAESFPDVDHDDQVDAAAGAFEQIAPSSGTFREMQEAESHVQSVRQKIAEEMQSYVGAPKSGGRGLPPRRTLNF